MAAESSDRHIRVDYLGGHMPAIASLHLEHHPYAPRMRLDVPFVTKWRHSPDLLVV
jgi:hypothetical protein